MTRWLNVASQIALGAGQIANIALPLLDERAKVLIAIGLGIFQLVISSLAHEFNPDGTSARAPYIPTK